MPLFVFAVAFAILISLVRKEPCGFALFFHITVFITLHGCETACGESVFEPTFRMCFVQTKNMVFDFSILLATLLYATCVTFLGISFSIWANSLLFVALEA